MTRRQGSNLLTHTDEDLQGYDILSIFFFLC